MPYVSTDIAAELARRNDEHEEEFYFLVTVGDVMELAVGVVPLTVERMARTLVEWEDLLRRNAARPGQRAHPRTLPPRPRRRRITKGRSS
jgi:hypothetical protein